jgi:uncharacterized lipoprotein NlpE involved in copper resistance
MKKYLILSAIAVIFAATGFAQNKEKNQKHINVPVAVKNSFVKLYPGTNAKWEKEDAKYESNFKRDGHNMSALFAEDGSLEETEMDIAISDLPATVAEYVKAHHTGATIKEAAKITKANGDINYEAEVKGTDLIFDNDGNFIKGQKD